MWLPPFITPLNEGGYPLAHAGEHRADVQSIKGGANGIAPDELLRVGQVLRLPSVLEGVAGADGADQRQRLALSADGAWRCRWRPVRCLRRRVP